MTLIDAIKEAILHGKTEDAITAYTRAISLGLAIKVNFKGAME